MFKFRFILDYFRTADAKGPILQANLRAKWLTRLCPDDLEIAFTPFKGQRPLYDADRIKIVSKNERNWWNHYFFNSYQMKNEKQNYSLGPNIYLDKPLENVVPLVVNSQNQKTMLLDKWVDYPEDSIHIIPTMIDNELFHEGEKAKEITVGWIGRDSSDPSTKGMEVIPYLAKRFPDIQFIMVHGNKPRFQHLWLDEELPNLKIYSQVPHQELAKMVRTWHVLICGSKWETGATHVKEAMASGVPVIAAKIGVLPEVAGSQVLLDQMKWTRSDKDPSLFVWTEEAKERFALALEDILGDSTKYTNLVSGALKQGQEAYPDRVAKQWFDFMDKCRDLKVK